MTGEDAIPAADAAAPADSEQLLEASWTDRGRAVRGRELGLELLMTSGFLGAVAALLALAGPAGGPHVAVVAVVAAYAIAARADFPIGSGHVVPTQLFLVPLFFLAPAALVPVLVYAGLALGVVGEAIFKRTRADRLAYCGGDAMHSLGPALVFVLLADGEASHAAAWVLVLAFAAQLAFDFLSSSLHDRLVFGTRPEVHVKVLLHVWGFDAALAPIGLLAAHTSHHEPLSAIAALPLVALLNVMAADRSRRIEHAHERLEALNRERRRREAAVQRLGDAFATNLDREALLRLVGRSATEALEGEAGHAVPLGGERAPAYATGSAGGEFEALLAEAERLALQTAPEAAEAEAGGRHAVAALIGDRAEPVGVVAVARSTPFSPEERSLLVHLCRQAAVSAANVVQHELLLEAEARLRHQAFHDPLTGLPNRALLTERVAQALTGDRRGDGEGVALLFVDLDGFKLVNDTLGHDAGDELLITTARRIRACLRLGDTAARLGGDEFAVLLEGLTTPEQADEVAERLRRSLSEPIDVRGHEFLVRGSIGLAVREAGDGRDDLLRHADLAMYEAKSRGGDRVARFRRELLSHADTRTELADDLRGAVARDELELRFQPIVDLADGRIRAVEALARWRHPRRGLLEPSAFVGLAEQTGTMHEIGRWVLDAACREAATWPGGEAAPSVTVNVSSAQLRNQSFAFDVAVALEQHRLPATRLLLEVAESVAMVSDADTERTIGALRRLGVGLALDDFGTGHSSLSHLARTKVDLLKLDRAFLAGVDEDPDQARLVGGVIGLAASLGVSIVAEGIERPEQLAKLRELGGHLGQGFLFGKPVMAGALSDRLGAEPPQPGARRLPVAS